MSEAQTTATSQQWRIDTWFPDLSLSVKLQLKLYYDEIIKNNKSGLLVSLKTVPMADAIHFSDCILGGRLCLSEINPGTTIYDIGSGNGFPGIVLAIISPTYKFVLVDLDPAKVDFLIKTVELLKLKNVEVKLSPIDKLEADSISVGITRGLANISKVSLMSRKCFKVGAKLFHFKNEQWGMEISEMPTQLCSVWSPSLLAEYKLPIGSIKFAIVKTEKINK